MGVCHVSDQGKPLVGAKFFPVPLHMLTVVNKMYFLLVMEITSPGIVKCNNK